MRIVILILMWVTPAIIAGMLGWKGIWGTGSAFTEYLVPIPVAGGVFHVPSFIVAAFFILTAHKFPETITRFLPVLAAAAFIVAITLQLDFARLNAWIFTDYEPYGSPVRFDGNPLFLFIATDALWVGIYGLLQGYRSSTTHWLLLSVVPLAIIGLQAFTHASGGPEFKIGGSRPLQTRGQEISMVYMSTAFDEQAIRHWLDSINYYGRPWMNPNTKHEAIFFTNSMQLIKWGKFEALDNSNTVATACLYEEDRSMIIHRGMHDCFSDRKTVDMRLEDLVTAETTGLGEDIDYWYAQVKLCDGVEIPRDYRTDIALLDRCRGLKRSHARTVERFINRYGEDSGQLDFVRARAASAGLVTD